jgi:hypothetical protein
MRHVINPANYGVRLTKTAFLDVLLEEMVVVHGPDMTVDELLLHPRKALNLCDHIRQRYGWDDLPDDLILRGMLTRRKRSATREARAEPVKRNLFTGG